MAEAQRAARPMEYYNPRPLILAACFFWGVAMGFCLFYFSPPKQMGGAQSAGEDAPEAPRSQLTTQERRRVDEPRLAEVAPAPETAAALPLFETMTIDPHMPAVTTVGGLSGRTAQPLVRRAPRPYADPSPAGGRRPPGPPAPPPIPELMP